MRRSPAISVFLLSGLVLFTGLALPVSAAPYVGGTTSWLLLSAPTVTSIEGQSTAVLTYQNNLNVTVLGLVVVAVHNSAGQTIFLSADTTLDIPAGTNSTAYAVIFGVAGGSYSTTIFAMSASGVALSAAATATLVV